MTFYKLSNDSIVIEHNNKQIYGKKEKHKGFNALQKPK